MNIEKAQTAINHAATTLALASEWKPHLCCLIVAIAYLVFNFIESMIERLIFGQPFLHWLDPIFAACFAAFAAHCVGKCALYRAGVIEVCYESESDQ